MGLSAGTRLGPYEITAPIGSGGMGEVYRARDTRLDRTVAIKVLNSSLASSPELKQRFEREARAVSKLNHPHICTLHDIGQQDGTDYLVMEFLEGESLAERLRRGALPSSEVLKIGIEIADALDKAHRIGIVHRDIKPGNIMLTPSGNAKLLDFGLAKPLNAMAAATSSSGSAPSFTASPTLTSPSPVSPLTTQGTILGTVQYMSPEQIEGKEADARSDIFSFGAVLYELATGKRAFQGKSQLKVASAILEDDPQPASAIQPNIAPALNHVIDTCLAKDPENRFQSAADVKLQLKWAAQNAGPAKASIPDFPLWRRLLSRSLTAIAIVLAIVLGWLYYQTRVQPQYSTHAFLLPPDKSSYNFLGSSAAGPVVISPDGRRIAFAASKEGTSQSILWVQPLNSATAQAMSGTEGATYPFWSHDSRFVGFFADGKLKKVDANGGPPQALCDTTNGRGGTWNQDDVILFARSTSEPLMRVSAAGGTPVNVTELDAKAGETSHRWPQFLPDGKHFIFYLHWSQGSGIAVGSLDSKVHKMLVRTTSSGEFADGHLLFVRDGTLMAQRLDTRKMELEADATPIADHVNVNIGTQRSVFTVSNTGTLVYMGGGATSTSQLTWYDRTGQKQEPALAETAVYREPALSPDGKRLAVAIQSGTSQDIWVVDLQRQTKTRITFGPDHCSYPVWSPDGKWIYYSSNRPLPQIYRRASDGTGGEETVLATEGMGTTATSISSDGKYLGYSRMDLKSATKNDAYALPLFGDHTPIPLVNTSANELLPRFSPDGKWIAYMSDETGRYEIYIKPFPGTGKYQVSTTGGFVEYWRGDGRELFYMSGDSLYTVDVQEKGNALELGTPHLLAKLETVPGLEGPFVPAADGKRFLVNGLGEQKGIQTLTLVNNWTADLKK